MPHAQMTYKRITEQFGDRLKTLRDRKNITGEELATAIGQKTGTYRRWERGETQPPLEAIYEIRRVTACDLNWLVCGDGDFPFLSWPGLTRPST